MAVFATLMSAGCAAELEPLSDEMRLGRLSTDSAAMFADQEPVSQPIDLYEAMARGLKYNLDKNLKLMERILVERGSSHVRVGMLPKLAASAGYRARDSFRGSSSRSLITGNESLEVSTSEDKEVRTADLQAVWNLLDFGLTYLRSKQEADRVLIAEERRIKVVQNLVMDIRDAYWRAVAAERLLPQVERVMARIETAIKTSQGVQGAGSGEPGDELRLQHQLLIHLRDLAEVRRKLAQAKSELAALMNVPPGESFRLAMPSPAAMKIPALAVDPARLAEAALLNRPELREEDYKKRISLTEVDAAYVRLLPGIELRAGPNWDSNSFLSEDTWNSAAATISLNIAQLFTAPMAIGFAEQDAEVADARRLSLSMAVIAQLHISLQRFALAKDVLAINRRLHGVDRQLTEIADRGSAASSTSENEVLTALSQKTVSELHYLASLADAHNAYGRVLNSAGLPRLPEDIEAMSVGDLAASLRDGFEQWRDQVPAVQVANQ